MTQHIALTHTHQLTPRRRHAPKGRRRLDADVDVFRRSALA
jgi:hypothetical protein